MTKIKKCDHSYRYRTLYIRCTVKGKQQFTHVGWYCYRCKNAIIREDVMPTDWRAQGVLVDSRRTPHMYGWSQEEIAESLAGAAKG